MLRDPYSIRLVEWLEVIESVVEIVERVDDPALSVLVGLRLLTGDHGQGLGLDQTQAGSQLIHFVGGNALELAPQPSVRREGGPRTHAEDSLFLGRNAGVLNLFLVNYRSADVLLMLLHHDLTKFSPGTPRRSGTQFCLHEPLVESPVSNRNADFARSTGAVKILRTTLFS